MEFWVTALVIAFVVRAILTSRYRSQLDEKFEAIADRLKRTESELDALRRAHSSLVAKFDDARPAPLMERAAPEPLAHARVILVDTAPVDKARVDTGVETPSAPERAAPHRATPSAAKATYRAAPLKL
jgi:hypothetical protein